MADEKSIISSIIERIEKSPEHTVFFLIDFSDIASVETVRKVFNRIRERNIVAHLAHGIYYKPKNSKFGEIPLPLELVAKAIARRDHVQILPSGATAANILGLSTQIPMTLSYLTTGTARDINIDNRTISYKRAAPKNFAYKGTTVPLIVQALKEIKKENIGEDDLSLLGKYVSNAPDKDVMCSDILLAPQWIQKIVKPMIVST